jgi:hypothetical protein
VFLAVLKLQIFAITVSRELNSEETESLKERRMAKSGRPLMTIWHQKHRLLVGVD